MNSNGVNELSDKNTCPRVYDVCAIIILSAFRHI